MQKNKKYKFGIITCNWQLNVQLKIITFIFYKNILIKWINRIKKIKFILFINRKSKKYTKNMHWEKNQDIFSRDEVFLIIFDSY